MRIIDNECVNCTSMGLPCMGSSCQNRNITRYYCDNCNEEFEAENLYKYKNKELCAKCILENYERCSK